MPSDLQRFEEKASRRELHVAVVGLGYVGLPLALSFIDGGCRVTGLDIDPAKPQAIAAGRSYLNYLPDAAVAAATARGFTATTDFRQAAAADAVIICVPTPLDAHHQPDLSFITGSLEALLPHLRRGQLVALESTTWPGTTEEVLRPRLENSGFVVGETLFLAYSPERQDPGNPDFGTRNIPKLVGGSTPACLKAALACYAFAVDRVVPVSSTRVAEMAKLLENIHRSVNIGLVNEMKMVADRMGIDIHEVIDAAATKPFGFVAYRPGPGLGGHCIPIDPFYLTWKAREVGVHTRFIELAGEINHAMPDWVIQKLLLALNERGKALKGSRVLVLGLAYKKNVDDLRESPSVEILHRLQDLGAEVAYSDPHIPVFPQIRRGRLDLASVPLDGKTLSGYDALMLVTAHDAFDLVHIARHAQLLVDTRGVVPPAANVVRA